MGPHSRGDIPALTPAEAGTRLSDPGGMQGWVDVEVVAHGAESKMLCNEVSKKKVAHTRLPRIVFRSYGTLLSVIEYGLPAGDMSHTPDVRLPLLSVGPAVTHATVKRAATSFAAWWTGTMGMNSLPKTVTRQRRDCDMNPCPSVPESSTLTTRIPWL